MSFINPLMLLGLGLIAVPVIIHLFNLRKARKINFSSLMFVRQVEETEIKKLRLKEIILLLIRIFLIVFLVLSFANPVIKSRFTLTDIKNKTVLLFFDDSFSLNNMPANSNYFEKSKSLAADIAGFYNPTDNLLIFRGTGGLIALTDVKESPFSHKPFFINEILETVNLNLAVNNSILNEVILISDFSAINFKEFNGTGGFSADKENVYFYLLDVSDREPSNVSVQNAALISEFPDQNADLVFRVRMKNHNDFPVSYASFEMRNNGVNVYSANLDFTENEIKELEVRFKPFSYGEQKIESAVIIPNPAEDEISDDNRFYNVVNIPENIRIMLVSDNLENVNYISKSLDVFNEGSGTGRMSYIIRNSVTEEINGYDVLYLVKKDFTESDVNLLEKFSSAGKGIFIFPPADAELQNFNSLLKRISSLGIESKEFSDGNVKISEIKTEHPLFKGVFRTVGNEYLTQSPESPDMKSYFRILAGENTYPVISLNNGVPLISEYSKGNSKIILSALPPDFQMSDIPAKNFFLPMLIRGVYLLSDNNSVVRNGRISSDFVREIIKKNIDTVFAPDGTGIAVSGNNLSKLIRSQFNGTGFYQISDSASGKITFAVNNDSAESFFGKYNENSSVDYFKSNGFPNVQYFTNTSDLKSAVENNRKGIELTPFFLILAVLFIILEIIYSSFLLRRKQKTNK